ncbi:MULTISPECIES: SLC13 family permease [unclassified Pseudoalteromonas]|uniref:SLC13 family permease n=1 Tax=unclassified Pseudoalteromonas TaxID=194690 RepID=UPI0003FA625E|nr:MULTISPECIES: SLC13 family permease [unclassified Pseudoalteromonas]MDC9501178.1 SLC13 family permease [Pseudoalteromonas sp. Angola-18]MDC9513026.1 SLC13 family permease [Pseudoalteromonas sp. CST1]MDC9537237.1 SLC13 family permease [Pseudoalteromonas sp. CST3]MDC9541551.1 SLC13 family permease [Pseudoalteromonas sp. CST2]MDC9544390.1 SLC13 family permease [Pseudoalteromonas sp. CST4]
MPLDAYLTLCIFALTILGLIVLQTRPVAVFGATLIALIACDLVSKDQFLTSIANPGLVTLILLVLCSLALEKTRLLRVIASKTIVDSYHSTWLRLFGVTTFFSSILNNTAVVATLLSPIRNNPHHFASKLLLPLSYASILGGTLTLIGTSTNLIVNSMYIEASGKSLSFFSFTAVGAILVLCCGLTMFFCTRMLPSIEQNKVTSEGYFIDAKVSADSELVGRSVEVNGLRHLESLFLVEIVREGRLISPVSPSEVIHPADRLIFCGDITKLLQLGQFSGLEIFAEKNGTLNSNLTEVVVRQESIIVGRTLKTTGFRALFDAAVVAIRRDGEQVSGKLGDVVIRSGDFLVLAVGDDYKSRTNINKNFLTLSGVEPESRINGWRAWFSIGGFITTIALAAVGVLDLLEGLVLLLGGLLFTRSLTTNELVRRFPIDIWLVVSSAILLSNALVNSGVVESLGGFIGQFDDPRYVYTAFVLVYVVTWLMTEFVTNNAAAALMFPIGYTVALGFGVDVLPFVMAVAFAASGSFISPYGYQTNLMVFNAGNYRLNDFVKIGLPISMVYALVVLVFVPVFFPFSTS